MKQHSIPVIHTLQPVELQHQSLDSRLRAVAREIMSCRELIRLRRGDLPICFHQSGVFHHGRDVEQFRYKVQLIYRKYGLTLAECVEDVAS